MFQRHIQEINANWSAVCTSDKISLCAKYFDTPCRTVREINN